MLCQARGELCDSGSYIMCIEQGCPHDTTTVELTRQEIAALRRELMPRMLVASVVSSNDVAARAIYKICPHALPWYKRYEIENDKSPASES